MRLRHLSTLLSLVATVIAQSSSSGANPFTLDPGFSVTAGKPSTLTWNPTTPGLVTLTLRDGPANNLNPGTVIGQSVPNTGMYTFTLPGTQLKGVDYTVEISSDSDSSDTNYSAYFTVDSANTANNTIEASFTPSSTSSSPSSTSSSSSSATASSTKSGASASIASPHASSNATSNTTSGANSSSASSSSSGSSTAASSTTSGPSSSSAAAATTSSSTAPKAAGTQATPAPSKGAASKQVADVQGWLGTLLLGAMALF